MNSNKEMKFCQSCGMPLTDDILGTNADGTKSEDYCIYCYKDGAFTGNFTMEQMVEYPGSSRIKEKKMSIFKFNTIALFTTDNQKVVDFYCDIFGFETSWNGMDIDIEMHLGDMRILLFPRDSIEKMTHQRFTYPSDINGTMEISFDVSTFADVDREYNRAIGMGAKPVMEPTTEPWGQRTCYVADPEGNLIEISSFNG